MPIDGPLMAIDGPHGTAMAIDELRWGLSTDISFIFQWASRFIRKYKTGSSQVGAISKAQKYSKNNYWKHLEKFFSKKKFEFFFRKKYFFRKSHNAEKLKKRPFRLIKRFYKPKTSKKCKGLPFDRILKFSKKSRIVPKKSKKLNERKLLVSHLLLEDLKICGLVRESNPRSPASQKIS